MMVVTFRSLSFLLLFLAAVVALGKGWLITTAEALTPRVRCSGKPQQFIKNSQGFRSIRVVAVADSTLLLYGSGRVLAPGTEHAYLLLALDNNQQPIGEFVELVKAADNPYSTSYDLAALSADGRRVAIVDYRRTTQEILLVDLHTQLVQRIATHVITTSPTYNLISSIKFDENRLLLLQTDGVLQEFDFAQAPPAFYSGPLPFPTGTPPTVGTSNLLLADRREIIYSYLDSQSWLSGSALAFEVAGQVFFPRFFPQIAPVFDAGKPFGVERLTLVHGLNNQTNDLLASTLNLRSNQVVITPLAAAAATSGVRFSEGALSKGKGVGGERLVGWVRTSPGSGPIGMEFAIQVTDLNASDPAAAVTSFSCGYPICSLAAMYANRLFINGRAGATTDLPVISSCFTPPF